MSIQLPFVLCDESHRYSNSPEDILTDNVHWHDSKNPYDLHNLSASLMGLMEIELIRVGDRLIDWSLPGGEYDLLDRTADWIQQSYQLVPPNKPAIRLGELMDALQIREFNFSDLRFLSSGISGGRVGLSPNMQTRLYKLLYFTEDIVDDADRLIMFPVNAAASSIENRPARIKTIGYAGDGIGLIRKESFRLIRWTNKKVVKLASSALDDVEAGTSVFSNRKLKQQRKHYIVYFKMPANLYENQIKFFAYRTRRIYVGSLYEWRRELVENKRKVEGLLSTSKKSWLPYADVPGAQEVIMATELQYLKKAPGLIRDYVIDADEFEALLWDKPSPRVQLKSLPFQVKNEALSAEI